MQKLINTFLRAKQAERKAQAMRILAEDAIVTALGSELKPEGSTSRVVGIHRLTVTTKLTRKLDFEVYESLAIPKQLDFVWMSPTIDLKTLRIAETKIPDIVARCITTTPAKTSIKVEEVK